MSRLNYQRSFPQKTRLLLTDVAIASNDNIVMTSSAVWDSGSTDTSISRRIIDELHLSPIGSVKMDSPDGTSSANQYKVDLILDDSVCISNVVVAEANIGNQNIDLLIGMDIIKLGTFSIASTDSEITLRFTID